MNRQDIINGITEIYSARGQVAGDATIATWLKYLQKFCIDKKINADDIQRGIEEYVVCQDQFPNLHNLLEKIKPSSKTKTQLEMRMIEDVIAGRMKYENLPAEVRKALRTIGGTLDYKTGNSYQRKEWIDKYQSIREQDDKGYTPIPASNQITQQEVEPVLVGDDAKKKIAELKAMIAQAGKEEIIEQVNEVKDAISP